MKSISFLGVTVRRNHGGWTGACVGAGTNLTATVNMTSALSCDAEFTPKEFDGNSFAELYYFRRE